MTQVENRIPPPLLLKAYSEGYFPMPDSETGEILWYRPEPRAILPLEGFHVSKSLKRSLSKKDFHVTFDTAFKLTMQACGNRKDTWITEEFIESYTALYQMGFGHSVEVWREEKLVGGLYGLSIGGAFFAESMFHQETDCSKIALFHLVKRLKEKKFALLEVQFLTPHLKSLGATEIADLLYQRRLKQALALNCSFT